MEQLSSCYFCGAALDASLSEYPVIPKELHPDPDEQRTVVLCQSCRHKLGTVVETVVGAIEEGAEGVETGRGTSHHANEGGAASGERVSTDSADESTDEAVTTAEATTASEAGKDADGGNAAADADGPENGVAGSEVGEDVATSGSSEAGSDDEETTDGETADADGDAGSGQTLTALEYNKVMRLLQNREFPVDRAEIREVAVNAYGISRSEFDAIIDAAIERGLIAERDGQFVSAE
ncbi:MAG: hypothetical protein ABEJ89_01395 [Haloarculaceae archaeon]